MPHVFISYVRENKKIIDQLCQELTVAGIKVWLDRNDIMPGMRWQRAIRRAIRDGNFFIACFSKEYNQRSESYMNEELTLAIEQLRRLDTDRIWFIPVKFSECDIPDRDIGGGETLEHINYVELHKDWEDGIRRILQVIQPDVSVVDKLLDGLIYRSGAVFCEKDDAELVWVPPGEFSMGSDPAEIDAMWEKFGWSESWKKDTQNESPKHTVYLDGYWMYKHPVTVKQYRQFCADTERQMLPEPDWGWHDDHPIVEVTRYDVDAYCLWAGMRLPTEAQWEKAVRGMDGRIFPWGDEWNSNRCNSSQSGIRRTTPVGSYPDGASPYGALDMAGNVREWCMDEYDPEFYSKSESREDKPVAGGSASFFHVLRGGSWDVSPRFVRATSRSWSYPLFASCNSWGFRCCC